MSKQQQVTSKIYYTTDEAGEILRRSTWSIRHDCKTGRIPYRQVGRRFLIPRSYFFPADLFPNAAEGATYATTME